jgi:hypothetical protein
MPQVKTQDLGKALSMVADKVKVTKETIVASKLKKAQKELYKDKVQGIANRFTSPNKMKPLIISKDNHIVDGHHRWGAAIYKWGDDVKLNVHRIHLSANNAIKLYKHIANTINEILENITIPIKVGDTVLGGKFKNKRIVVKSIDKNEKGDITINGKPLLKYRLVNEGKNVFDKKSVLTTLGRMIKKPSTTSDDILSFIDDYISNMNDRYDGDSKISDDDYDIVSDYIEDMYDLEMTGSSKKETSKVKTQLLKHLQNTVNEGNDQLEMMKLLSKAMKAMPGSPKQKKIKQELNKLRIKNGLEPLPESTLEEADAKRDYKKEYEKYGKSEKAKKYRAELNKYNRQKGTYGNGDGKDASHKGGKIVGFEDQSKNRGRREKSRLKKEACWKGYKQVGGKKKGGKMVPNCVPINEIPMADLKKIDTFADKKLNPMDVVITDKHFFDRLNDPRNGKEISSAELIGFFKRLSKKKNEFVEFLNKYNSIVATDDRTNINIPFMKKANKAIAKTVMRKKDFKTPDKRLDI